MEGENTEAQKQEKPSAKERPIWMVESTIEGASSESMLPVSDFFCHFLIVLVKHKICVCLKIFIQHLHCARFLGHILKDRF